MRTFEQSTRLIDEIVGRCVREPAFGRAVIHDPEQTLAAYALNEAEMKDFLALRAQLGDEALGQWAQLRASLFVGESAGAE
jgi:hypothetical protein